MVPSSNVAVEGQADADAGADAVAESETESIVDAESMASVDAEALASMASMTMRSLEYEEHPDGYVLKSQMSEGVNEDLSEDSLKDTAAPVQPVRQQLQTDRTKRKIIERETENTNSETAAATTAESESTATATPTAEPTLSNVDWQAVNYVLRRSSGARTQAMLKVDASGEVSV